MLRSYLIVALRNLVRHKLYSTINVVGLSVGISFCILSALYVRQELSYDDFHRNGTRIYLAYRAQESSDGSRPGGWTPPVLAPALQANVPGVAQAIRVHGMDLENTIVHRGAVSHLARLLMVDPAFLSAFSFPQVAGMLPSALDDPASTVITRRLASLCFGNDDPVGQTLTVYLGSQPRDFTVTAVTDVPANSSLTFDLLLSHALRQESRDWGSNHVYTFVLLAPGASAKGTEERFDAFFDRYFAADRAAGRNWGGLEVRLRLMPLRDLYLNTRLRPFITLQSNPAYVYVVSSLGLVVLLIACINSMNLSLGLASTRLREVGVRKSLGAVRRQLAHQFLGEAVLLSALSLFLAVGLTELLLPVFCHLVQRQVAVHYAAVWPVLVGLGLVVAMATGLYPALLMSALPPATVLRRAKHLGGASWLGRALVTTQLSLSIGLVACTLIMVRQLSYLRSLDLGFHPAHVVVIDARQGLGSAARLRLLDRYRQLAATDSRVLSVTATNMSIGVSSGFGTSWRDGVAGPEVRVDTYTVDYGYPETMGIRLLAGRDFSPAHPTDQEEAILVNESLARLLPWDEPLGQTIPSGENSMLSGRVIGVLADTHIEPLRQGLVPAMFRLRQGNGGLCHVLVRISPGDPRATLAELQRVWAQAAPDLPFTYSFMDQDVDRTFQDDERWMRIARYSAGFATFLACLGAFGLTSLAVARRTKEVGIRKVLGASAVEVTALLSREFALLAVAATGVTWPVAFAVMRSWLGGFAYRIELDVGPLLLAGGLTLAIVLVTVGSQTLRAALASPVDALRYE